MAVPGWSRRSAARAARAGQGEPPANFKPGRTSNSQPSPPRAHAKLAVDG